MSHNNTEEIRKEIEFELEELEALFSLYKNELLEIH